MRVAQKKKTFARTAHQSPNSNPKTLRQRKKTDNNRREPQRLKSAEPEGVALARPPENIFVKDILEIVGGSTPHEKGAISDVLLRRDQAAQKALEGITLKSLVEENSATVLQFPYSGSATQASRANLQNRPNDD
jgi:hypothetical protein